MLITVAFQNVRGIAVDQNSVKKSILFIINKCVLSSYYNARDIFNYLVTTINAPIGKLIDN